MHRVIKLDDVATRNRDSIGVRISSIGRATDRERVQRRTNVPVNIIVHYQGSTFHGGFTGRAINRLHRRRGIGGDRQPVHIRRQRIRERTDTTPHPEAKYPEQFPVGDKNDGFIHGPWHSQPDTVDIGFESVRHKDCV